MKRWYLLILLFCLIQPSRAYNTIEIPLVAEYGRGTINAMQWNPAGDVLAVASGNGIWFYDAEFNTLGHWGDSNAYELAWSENGAYLATSMPESEGGAVYILSDGLEMLFTARHERFSNAVFAWHGQRLAYSFDYEDVHLVDAPEFSVSRLISNNDAFSMLAWSPDGSQLLGINSMRLWLWDTARGELIANFAIDYDARAEYPYFEEAVLWDAERLSVLCTTGDIDWGYYLCEWDWATNSLSWSEVLALNTSYLGRFTFFSPDDYIFIHNSFVYPSLLRWRNGTEYKAILDGRDIATYALHPDGESMSIGTRTGDLIQYDLSEGSILHEANLHTFYIWDMAWHPTDGRLAIAGRGFNYDVRILQLDSNENLIDTGVALPTEISQQVAWSEDGTQLYIWGETYGDRVNLWAYATYDAASYELLEWTAGQDDSSSPLPLEMDPDHAGDLVAMHDYEAEVIQISNGVELQIPSNSVKLMAWSPDDNHFAAIIAENTQFGIVQHLFVWDSQSWELIRQERGHADYDYTNFSWSPDSQYIAYKLINYREDFPGRQIVFLAMPNAPELPPMSVEMLSPFFWSADGRILLVKNNYSIDFHEFPSQNLLASIEVSSHYLEWRGDGHYLATSAYGRVSVWDTSALFAQDG
jgi:WD40 repeat protein